MLYSLIETHRHQISPWRLFAKYNKELHGNPWNPYAYTTFGRSIAASYELFERVTRQYNKPEFNIADIQVDNQWVPVRQRVVKKNPFCRLLHFKKIGVKPMPTLLIVAPMSGHYATLCRGTVKGLLPFFDVYVTDWINAREVPSKVGPFTLNHFIDYLMEYMTILGPSVNVLAVCQPSVPVIAATAIMSAEKHEALPNSITLMGGPIDTRKNPTDVNNFAAAREIEWFENYAITKVPLNYPGGMRDVYPGFLQLAGFMAMNLQRHLGEHLKFYYHLVEGDGDSAIAHKAFYNEYLSVMDLPAEFYLQTVKAVFKDHLLPLGKLKYRGKTIDLKAIEKVKLLAIEGEKDDISGVGQTKSAITLCKNLPDSMKHYHLQKNVGHYGIFNGRRFREQIVPLMQQFIMHQTSVTHSSAKKKNKT